MPAFKNFPKSQFFTVETWITYPRYFNGRKFSIDKYLTHYIAPNDHKKNFTDMVNAAVLYNGSDYLNLRYSRFTFTAREQMK